MAQAPPTVPNGVSPHVNNLMGLYMNVINDIPTRPLSEKQLERIRQQIKGIHNDGARSVKARQQEKIRRPANAFMLFSKDRRRTIALEHPSVPNHHISKILGMEWSQMAEKEKQPFIDKAKRMFSEHKLLYPKCPYYSRQPKPAEPAMHFPSYSERSSSAVFMNCRQNQAPGSPTLNHRMYSQPGNQCRFNTDLYNRNEKPKKSHSPNQHLQNISPVPAEPIFTRSTVPSGLNLPYASKPEIMAHNMPSYSSQFYNSAMLTPPSSNSPGQYNINSSSPSAQQNPSSVFHLPPFMASSAMPMPTVSSGLNLPHASKPEESAYNMPLSYSSQFYNNAMLTPPSSNLYEYNVASSSPSVKQEVNNQNSSPSAMVLAAVPIVSSEDLDDELKDIFILNNYHFEY